MSPFEPTESPKKMPKETDSSGKDHGGKILVMRKNISRGKKIQVVGTKYMLWEKIQVV